MLRDFGFLRAPWFVQVVRDSDEIARVELDEKVSLEGYLGPSGLPGPAPLEIQFIEVSPRIRRKGVGAAVIAALAARHPDRRLVAFSEGADEFWSGLDWARHEHPSRRNYRPLYIQPLLDMGRRHTSSSDPIEPTDDE
ncbi:GNAT family N-acetyltransferase [Nocardia testacea]|uniref:GNAT family N-acetyltransferase n=1 Tax=Nocardia testacea TaxID=248551 RepID=UPI003A871A11